jgi:hypothetical protein
MNAPRSLLSATAFGDDPAVTPADRVRALSELRELARMDESLDLDYRELKDIPDGELDALIDGVLDEDEGELQRRLDGTTSRPGGISEARDSD